MIEAVFRNSPLHFKISRGFAEDCLHRVGSVVRHQVMGPLFCEEVVIADDGTIVKVILLGTTNGAAFR